MVSFFWSTRDFEYRPPDTCSVKSGVLRSELRIVRLGTVSGDPKSLLGTFGAAS